MDTLPPRLEQLTKSLRILPGVGARSAVRMALRLVEEQHKQSARKLAEDIQVLTETISRCCCCRHLATEQLCVLCQTQQRDDSQVCVVESPVDLLAIESSGGYKGRYFVLHGRLSPIDGVGPELLGFAQLESIIAHTHGKATSQQTLAPACLASFSAPVNEVILALSTTVEGNVTCHYLQRLLLPYEVRITRPSQGIPAGGNVEMLDSITIGQALQQRIDLPQ